MNEPEVLNKTHAYLMKQGLSGIPILRLFTDAHPTLTKEKNLAPFQRFIMDMKDYVVHPDLVGQLQDGETLFAVEGKGSDNILGGLAQAELYQNGFHYSFLSADTRALSNSYIAQAKQKEIGIIAVGDEVKLLNMPRPRMPFRDIYRFIARQMEGVIQSSPQQTFLYNLPTHYLVWVILLDKKITVALSEVPVWSGYPMPKDWKSALAGAQKLGLINILGDQIALSPLGMAAKELLPTDIGEWAVIHKKMANRGNKSVMSEIHPQAAALLRILLLQDPMVRFVIEGLELCPEKTATFTRLAAKCDTIDHAKAPVFFLKPDAHARHMDNRGRINWENVPFEDYRSTMYFQFKSILKHAGFIAPTALGGATSKGYNQEKDIWTLL